MTIASPTLQDFDPELAQAMRAEAMRQEDHAELIASENYASPLVMAVQDSVFTNKYAEGYPGRRYYSGCEHVDVAERLALERVKALFDCDYANVQPHAGAQANAAVFLALTRPGDTVMGMNLAQGGHLTHGNPSARCSGWTWRTWPDWSPRACIPTRCRARGHQHHATLRGRARHHPWRGQDEDFCRKLDSAVFPASRAG